MSDLTLSVVIPAYNEADSIAGCLAPLFDQIDDIDEIIVVDNNSTDATAAIVASFQEAYPKLRLVHETKAGVAHARNAGFDAATSDIIARIDADTIVTNRWAVAIRQFFNTVSPDFAAGMSTCTLHDLPFQAPFDKMHQSLRDRAQKKLDEGGAFEIPQLSGANMAIRKTAWSAIRDMVNNRPDIMDDFDMSLCLQEVGQKMALIPGMEAQVSGRRLLSSPKSYWKYLACTPNTFKLRGQRRQELIGWASVGTSAAFQLVMWVPFRSYDPVTKKLSLKRVFTPLDARENPVSIDR